MTDKRIIRIGADEAIETLKQAPYLAPFLKAILENDIHVLPIDQGIKPFGIPSMGRPWIVVIQDDPKPGNLSLGPEGFDRKSLEAAIQAATLAAVMACDPIMEIYATVANEAAVKHNNAILVETWLTHESQWTKLIKKTNPDIQLTLGTVESGRA